MYSQDFKYLDSEKIFFVLPLYYIAKDLKYSSRNAVKVKTFTFMEFNKKKPCLHFKNYSNFSHSSPIFRGSTETEQANITVTDITEFPPLRCFARKALYFQISVTYFKTLSNYHE